MLKAGICLWLLALPFEVLAVTPVVPDEFGVYLGVYPALQACRESGAAQGNECGGANGEICSFAGRSGEVTINQSDYLGYLVSGLRKRGLWRTSQVPQAKWMELRLAWEAQHTLPSSPAWIDLRAVPQQSADCAAEQVDRTLAKAEAAINAGPLSEEVLTLATRLAFTQARIGNRKSAGELVERLLPEIERRRLEGSPIDMMTTRLAMALAELGELERAAALISATDHEHRGAIAQIALRQGKLADAVELAGPDGGVPALRLLIIKAFVEKGLVDEGRALAGKWRMERSTSAIPGFHKVAALVQAKKDPVGAKEYLRQEDPEANSNGLAVVAALEGNPKAAEAVLDIDYLDRVGFARASTAVTDTAYSSLTEAWTRIAIAYEAQGRVEDAVRVLETAAAQVRGRWCSSPGWCGERLAPLAYAFAYIGKIDEGVELIAGLPQQAIDLHGWRGREATVENLREARGKHLVFQGHIDEALSLLNLNLPGKTDAQLFQVAVTLASGTIDPGPLLFGYPPSLERMLY